MQRQEEKKPDLYSHISTPVFFKPLTKGSLLSLCSLDNDLFAALVLDANHGTLIYIYDGMNNLTSAIVKTPTTVLLSLGNNRFMTAYSIFETDQRQTIVSIWNSHGEHEKSICVNSVGVASLALLLDGNVVMSFYDRSIATLDIHKNSFTVIGYVGQYERHQLIALNDSSFIFRGRKGLAFDDELQVWNYRTKTLGLPFLVKGNNDNSNIAKHFVRLSNNHISCRGEQHILTTNPESPRQERFTFTDHPAICAILAIDDGILMIWNSDGNIKIWRMGQDETWLSKTGMPGTTHVNTDMHPPVRMSDFQVAFVMSSGIYTLELTSKKLHYKKCYAAALDPFFILSLQNMILDYLGVNKNPVAKVEDEKAIPRRAATKEPIAAEARTDLFKSTEQLSFLTKLFANTVSFFTPKMSESKDESKPTLQNSSRTYGKS